MYEAIPLWKQVILEKLSNAIGKTTLLVLEYPHCSTVGKIIARMGCIPCFV